ncbi:S8 family peptidase [Sporosarcina obsidiansis]|uniref:S8 family peptidase n=1 Tax=Sporosarcina obsidiansis TaxID=2660748 RepID=UPI00129B410B|nr:S8 family peptidase [Sporosarcina obsidiansis]
MHKWLNCLIVSVFVVSVFLNPSVSFAVQQNGNLNTWTESTNVELDKEWEISFSEEINNQLLVNDFIYVIDSAGEKVQSDAYYNSLTQKIHIQAPRGGYAPNSNYTLVIEEGLQSRDKKKLRNTVHKPFITGEAVGQAEDFVERPDSKNNFSLQEELSVVEETAILDDNYDSHSIRVDASRAYSVDEIIILPPTEQYPFGYAAKITSVKSIENGFELTVVEPEMDEVVKEFDVSKEQAVNGSDVKMAKELTEMEFSSNYVDQLGLLDPRINVIDTENGFSLELFDIGYEVKGESEPVDGVTVSGDAGVKLNGVIHFKDALTTLDIEKTSILSLPVVHNLSFSAKQELKLAAELYGDAKVDMKFPLADIPVPYASVKAIKNIQAGVFVRLYLVMEYDANGKAHFSVSQEYHSETGLNRTDEGKYQPYKSFEKLDPAFKIEELTGHLGMKKGLQFDVAGAILQWDLISLQNKGTINLGVDAGTLIKDSTELCYDFGASLNYDMSANVLSKEFPIMNNEYSLVRFSNCELSDLNFADEQLEVNAGDRKKLEIFGELPDGSKVDFLLPNDYISFSSTNPDIKVDVRGNIVVANDIQSGANSQIKLKYKTSNVKIEKSLALIVNGVEEDNSNDGTEVMDMEQSIIRTTSPDVANVFKFIPSKEDLQSKTHASIGFESDVPINVSLYTSPEALAEDKPYQVSTNIVRVPLAFEGPYYVKVISSSVGEFRANPAYETMQPEDHPNGGACAVEATTSDVNVIKSLQFIRDDFLTETTKGQDVINLYNKLSPTVVWSILKDSSLRKSLLSDLKKIDHLIQELYRVAQGNTTSHVITKEEEIAIQSIIETVKDYLPESEVKKLEEMQIEMSIDTMVAKKLDAFLNEAQLTNAKIETVMSDELIIKLKDSEKWDNAEMQIQSMILSSSLMGENQLIHVEPLYGNTNRGLDNTYVVSSADSQSLLSIKDDLENNKAVEYVQLSQIYSITTTDVNYQYQWPLANSNQVVGGDLKFASIQKETNNKKMKDVIVAVIDTGVNYELADFKNIVLRDKGYDFVNNDEDPMDDNDHGTHVAGIIGAKASNGYSIAGLNQHNKIIPIKVLDKNGRGSTRNIARGITHAVDNGAQVINLSLGTSSFDQTIEEAIIYATNNNVTVVAATGNDGREKLSYPAVSEYTVSVGATTAEGVLASFSNYGKGIDIVAPGEKIPSLVTSGEVMYASGTSMATPYAAAQIALLYSVADDMNMERVKITIENHHVDLGDSGYDVKYGWGQLETVKAMQSLE